MLNSKEAKKVLSKKDQDHLTLHGINTMTAMRRQAVFMSKHKANGKSVCFDCWIAAKKLGLVSGSAL